MTTIYSIAARCGVSPSTVSRAFNRPELVRREVRARILAVAEEVGYRPNRSARVLASGRTDTIGLLVPDITNPFFPPLVRVIEQQAWLGDRSVLLVDTGEDVDREHAAISRLRGQVDGIIMISSRSPSKALRDALAGTKGVLVNRASRVLPHVIVDDSGAMGEVVDTLRDLGHREIAYVSGPADSWMNSRRQHLLTAAAEARGVRVVPLEPRPATHDGGRQAVRELLDGGCRCAVAFDDMMASGLLVGLVEAGHRVPDDVSVVGCDDIAFSSMLHPAMSSIASSPRELAAAALSLLPDPQPAQRSVRVASTFVRRGSTGPARP